MNPKSFCYKYLAFYYPIGAPKVLDSSKVSNSVNSSGHPTRNPSEKHYQRQSLDSVVL